MISYSGDSDILRLSSHLKKLTYQSKSWIALWFVASPPLIGERAVFALSLGHIRNILGALFLFNFLSLCCYPYRQELFTVRNVCINEGINFLSVSQVKALDLKQVYPLHTRDQIPLHQVYFVIHGTNNDYLLLVLSLKSSASAHCKVQFFSLSSRADTDVGPRILFHPV